MVAPKSDKPAVIRLPPDVAARVNAVARAERRTADDVVAEACRRLLALRERRQLDDQYQRGYEQVPEDAVDAEALLPHLPLPREDWT